jgi:phosphate acetyltransferase
MTAENATDSPNRGSSVPKAPHFSDIEPGTELPPMELCYEQEAIDRYAVASLDMNPVHTNEDWAARAQVFGVPETVGHGMMTMSSLASVVSRAWGPVSANGGAIRFVKATFTKPVKVGETVVSRGFVKKKHYGGAGRNWVTIKVEARDTAGDLIGLAEVGYNLPD